MELGLGYNEARVYVALLGAPRASAAAVAHRAGVPRPKVYEALRSLEAAGFCTAGGERVAVYDAVPADEALAEWLRRREEERRAAASRDRALREELVAALPAHPREDADDVTLMEGTVGHGRTLAEYERLVESARRRLDVVFARPYVQPPDRWSRLEIAAVRRGVEVRLLCSAEAADDPARWRQATIAGAECRLSANVIPKLIVCDAEEAMVALRDRAVDDRFVAVNIRHSDLVAPLQLLFNREWRRAAPVDRETLDKEEIARGV